MGKDSEELRLRRGTQGRLDQRGLSARQSAPPGL